MFTIQKADWSLLAKYLAGETGEIENSAMEKWLNDSPENRALFGKIKSDWKIMDTMNKQFNVDNAWNKLHGRIINHDSSAGTDSWHIVGMRHRRSWLTPLQIAASLLFVCMLGILTVYFTGKTQKITISTAYDDTRRQVHLPDGSTVYLNASTRLSYVKRFNYKIREVTLAGEAFFEWMSLTTSRPTSAFGSLL